MPFADAELDAFATQMTVDITTTGRRTGQARRVEIWWFRVDGRFVITGTPGKRDWLANVRANPHLTVHVGEVDIEATVTEIEDPVFRRVVFEQHQTSWYVSQTDVESLVATAPLIELHF